MDAPTSAAKAGDDDGKSVVISNQLCLNRCVSKDKCRWFTKSPTKKANCMQRCHRECVVCPLSTISAKCAKQCEGKCAGNVACLHACMEDCPCEDLSHEIKTLVSLFPDAEEATHLAKNTEKHFVKASRPATSTATSTAGDPS